MGHLEITPQIHLSPEARRITMNTRFTMLGIFLALLQFFLVFLVGCASLSPGARQIYMTNSTQEVSACTRVGHVSAKSMACVDPSSCTHAAMVEGRNKAAELGATHLVTTYSGISLTHGLYEGDAYKCANNQVGVQRVEIVAPNAAAVGCTRDIECKGERVCEGGRCVPPGGVPTPE
jgi:hypothetical protein